MDSPSGGRLNVALIGAAALGAFCWICLYAAFADYAQMGFELMAQPTLLHNLGGATLVLLHALGLLLLFLLAGGAFVLIISEALTEHVDNRRFNGTTH